MFDQVRQAVKATMGSLADEVDDAFVQQLVDAFCSDTRLRLESMPAAIHGSLRDELKRDAHTIKGSGANLGFEALSALARELESRVDVGADPKLLHEAFDAVSGEFLRIEKLLGRAGT